jgi:hypothetical protein
MVIALASLVSEQLARGRDEARPVLDRGRALWVGVCTRRAAHRGPLLLGRGEMLWR